MANTLTLKEWVPQLARDLAGKHYSPNYDMITHLQAQKVARRLGIAWSNVMLVSDIEAIKTAMLV